MFNNLQFYDEPQMTNWIFKKLDFFSSEETADDILQKKSGGNARTTAAGKKHCKKFGLPRMQIVN